MYQIESIVKASMLDLKLLFFRAKLELETAQHLKIKGSRCATPKENTNKISAVDEEYFLVFLLTLLSF